MVGVYTGRILKGESPQLPVQQSAKAELLSISPPRRRWDHDSAVDPGTGGRGDRISVLDQRGRFLMAALGSRVLDALV